MTTDTQRHMQRLHEIARTAIERAYPYIDFDKTHGMPEADVYVAKIIRAYITSMRALLADFPIPSEDTQETA